MHSQESLFQTTLRSVVFAVLGPALIMLQIGALVFFLVEIMYRGNYQMPVHSIFGLFVFAIVLISRISIEEGFERAAIFGFLLFGAVSAVSGIGIHSLVLLAIWWIASKLTWDCTFVDTSRDVTGQGLVKTAEMRGRRLLRKFGWLQATAEVAAENEPPSQPPIESATRDADGIEEPPSGEQRIGRELRRILWERRSKNTPGLWTFYFFVAGLPIFAFGQWFVRSGAEAKANCIRLFAVYVFSGLALMMLTSLIGLTRYVRSRNAELSDSIARRWLTWGTAVAAAMVLAVVLVPWPTSGLNFAGLMPNFQTRERIGNSPLSERGRVQGQNGGGRSSAEGAPGNQGSQPAEREGAGGAPGGQQTGNQPQGRPGNQSGGSSPGGKGQKPAGQSGAPSEQSDQKSPKKSGPSQPAAGAKSNQDNPPQASKPTDQSTPPQQKKSTAERNPPQARSQSTQGEPQNRSAAKPSQNSPQTQQPQPSQTQPQPPRRNNATAANPPRENPSQRSQTDSSRQSSARQPSQQPRSQTQPDNPTQLSGGLFAGVMAVLQAILRFVVLAALVVAAMVLLVKYHRAILLALSSFFASLSTWWSSLFRRGDVGQTEHANRSAAPEIWRRFDSFRDPFAAKDRSPAQIVAESYSAFESFSREFGLRREPRETPMEFAQRVRRRFEQLGKDSEMLAELYSRLAYGGRSESLTAAAVAPLRSIWSKMREIHQHATVAEAVT